MLPYEHGVECLTCSPGHCLLLLPLLLLSAAGLVWWQRGQQYYGGVQAASDILGLLFFILLFPSMRALFRALFTFPNEYRMLLKVRVGWVQWRRVWQSAGCHQLGCHNDRVF